VKAADEAEKTGGKYLDMVSFFPAQRKKAMDDTAGAVRLAVEGTGHKCDFAFTPLSPFAAPPHQRGWRLIGRDLVWRIEDAVRAADYGAAVQNANLATKFGFDISGGCATDASLGLAIVDNARQAIAPALDHMDAGQLASLSEGIKRALQSEPTLSTTIDHEHECMLLGVQAVQDAYRANNFDVLMKQLGPDTRSAVDFLDDLHRKDNSKRPQYFQDFAAEADAEQKWSESIADIPVAQRAAHPEPRFKGDRPYKKFAKQFFNSVKPLVELHDATLARTRLLILEASILSQIKRDGAAPKDLTGLDASLITDPYSGKPFIYGADGKDYHVYSVGSDFRDDGGETDETFSQPDLRLEKGF